MIKKEFNPNNIDEIYNEVLKRKKEWLLQKSLNEERYNFIIELSSDNKKYIPVSEFNLKNEMIELVKGYINIIECKFPKSQMI